MAAYSKHVYAPKIGDEVRWPNGLIMTCDAEGVLVVTGVPDDDVVFTQSRPDGSFIIGVTE